MYIINITKYGEIFHGYEKKTLTKLSSNFRNMQCTKILVDKDSANLLVLL